MLSFLKRFALPIGIALAFCAALVIVQSSEAFQDCIENAQYKAVQASHPKQLSDVPVTFIMRERCWGDYVHRQSDVIIALFTIILAGSTIALWAVTRIVAIAAQKSADAAIAAERARFYVVEGENNFMDFVSTVIEWIDASGGKMPGKVIPFIKINFKNFGKSPGIIQEICCDLKFSIDPFDPICTLRDVKEYMIAAGNSTQEILCTGELSIEEIKLLHQGTGHLWIHGRVYYKDVFNNKQVHRFFRRFTRITRLGSPDLYGLRSYDYKNYNEST